MPLYLKTNGWKKLHNEELHNLYCSPNIIRVIKSRRMRWARHVTRMRQVRNAFKMLVGTPVEKKSLENEFVDGRTI
jgi:hypothetical protein